MAFHGSEWEQASNVQRGVRPQKLFQTRGQGSFIYPKLIPQHSVSRDLSDLVRIFTRVQPIFAQCCAFVGTFLT